MCRLSSSEYDLYRRVNSKPGRHLFGWLRGLLRPRRRQLDGAEVVAFPAEVARPEQEAAPGDSKAA